MRSVSIQMDLALSLEDLTECITPASHLRVLQKCPLLSLLPFSASLFLCLSLFLFLYPLPTPLISINSPLKICFLWCISLLPTIGLCLLLTMRSLRSHLPRYFSYRIITISVWKCVKSHLVSGMQDIVADGDLWMLFGIHGE